MEIIEFFILISIVEIKEATKPGKQINQNKHQK
jgi:hypothetical protein